MGSYALAQRGRALAHWASLAVALQSSIVSAHSTALRARARSLAALLQFALRRAQVAAARARRFSSALPAVRSSVPIRGPPRPRRVTAKLRLNETLAQCAGAARAGSRRSLTSCSTTRRRRWRRLYTVVLFKWEALSLAAAPHLDNTDSQFFDSAFFSKSWDSESTRRFHAVISQKNWICCWETLKLLWFLLSAAHQKKLIFFWHYEPWICQEGLKNNKKYFQERFLKKRSLDTFNSDGSHQAETTSPSRGAVVFDTSYPTPNSYIMCKFLFDFDLSIYVRRFDRKKSDNLETSRFFWQFWHLWKKFDIFQKYKLVFRNWQLALFKIGNICSRILVDCVDSLKSWNCN